MSRRRQRPASREPIEVAVEELNHDGRGVGRFHDKPLLVRGALPGERVRARPTTSGRQWNEAETLEVIESSPHRAQPRCPHFGMCGGCSLQHLEPAEQIKTKQSILEDNLARIGKVRPDELWTPLEGPRWGYRRKARLSVRYVPGKGRTLVGFREVYGRFVCDMQECHVLDERLARHFGRLTALVDQMDARGSIPQIEVACGDDNCALVFRHLESLSDRDLGLLVQFARETSLAILLQPAGPDSIQPLEPAPVQLTYRLPDFDLELGFGPADFIQINAAVNRLMVSRAVELLMPGPQHRVLDLFCGLGNFTLPIATRSKQVVGVEGSPDLVRLAGRNADRNGLTNIEFHVADLAADASGCPWLSEPFDSVLIDPPRSGAESILPHLARSGAERLVYVSCHPASLARDAGILVQQLGFTLAGAGVMDMFPHTTHVESIALFLRDR
jgi:23S rRNA (uracil1939-C5)-methyltransferase